MFPTMRRRKQEMEFEDAVRLLRAQDYGVLALANEAGAPYALPLNHVYLEQSLTDEAPLGALYFHCALQGCKVDIITQNPQASFCVVGKHAYIPQKFATTYESVIAFGRISFLEGEAKTEALYQLSKCFDPEEHEIILAEIEKDGPRCHVLELKIERLTGKVSPDLMKERS